MDMRRARHTHAHHTRPRFHKNIAQPHQTKDNNRMCAVTGMARVLDVESVQPKTNTNLRHVSNMANSEPQNPHAPEHRVRESQMFQRIESETWPFKQRRTWTTCDQRGGCNHRERMLKLSLSSVAAPHRPRPCPTVIRRPETHPSTRTFFFFKKKVRRE